MNKEIASNLFRNDVISLLLNQIFILTARSLFQWAERVDSLIFELMQVSKESFQLARILDIIWFIPQKCKTFIWEGKCSKHERLNWLWKVLVLCFLAVFVHYVTNNCEVNYWFKFPKLITLIHILLYELVIFGVSVRK